MDKNNIKTISPLSIAESTYDKLIFGLLIFILTLIPIITRVKAITNIFPSINMYDGLEKVLNASSYYKFQWLIISTILLVAVFIFKIFQDKYEIKLGYTTIPIVVMFITIVISGFLTNYKDVGFYGLYSHYEGTLAFILYLILFTIAINTDFSGGKVRWLFIGLYPLTFINFVMTLIKFFKYNLLDLPIGSLLILPSTISRSDTYGLDELMGNTMGNPDYQSALGAVLTVIFLTRGILAKDKKTKLWSYIFGLLAFTILITSFATSGFVTLVILMPFIIFLIFKLKERKQAIRMGIIYLLGFIVVFTALNAVNPDVMNNTVGSIISLGNKASTPAPTTENSQQSLAKEFNLPQEGVSAGSGRLYIWKKTIPLIKAKPLLGYGMDTLLFVFPQDDPEKIAGLGDANVDVDKSQ